MIPSVSLANSLIPCATGTEKIGFFFPVFQSDIVLYTQRKSGSLAYHAEGV